MHSGMNDLAEILKRLPPLVLKMSVEELIEAAALGGTLKVPESGVREKVADAAASGGMGVTERGNTTADSMSKHGNGVQIEAAQEEGLTALPTKPNEEDRLDVEQQHEGHDGSSSSLSPTVGNDNAAIWAALDQKKRKIRMNWINTKETDKLLDAVVKKPKCAS